MDNQTIIPVVNNSVSVDCVVFGFDGIGLKVLLVERKGFGSDPQSVDYKLPGSMIFEHEQIEQAAYRVLDDMTGIDNIYLKQLHVFSDPKRVEGSELQWICDYYGIRTQRVVTVAFYALMKLTDYIVKYTTSRHAVWVDAREVRRLAMDHKQILMKALNVLEGEVELLPVAARLLPRKFTIRQLQNLYQAVWGVEVDNRNFRKKILSSGVLVATGIMQTGVAHKPAQYYSFNRKFKSKSQPASQGF